MTNLSYYGSVSESYSDEETKTFGSWVDDSGTGYVSYGYKVELNKISRGTFDDSFDDGDGYLLSLDTNTKYTILLTSDAANYGWNTYSNEDSLRFTLYDDTSTYFSNEVDDSRSYGTYDDYLTFTTPSGQYSWSTTVDWAIKVENPYYETADYAVTLFEGDLTSGALTSNTAPSITSTPSSSVNEDSAYTYSMSATDTDVGDSIYTDPANFTLPSWLSLSGTTISGTPSNSDVGTHNVTVAIKDNNGGTDTQSFTITVENANDSPTGSASISGTAAEGETLTAVTSSIADADGLGSFSYQWLRDGSAISGATNSTYSLTNFDVGSAVSVRVSYTDGQGTAETFTSSATSSVQNVNDSPTGSASISGTAAEGETLTAVTSSIADADGLGSFSYQWLRDGSAISGATSSTYALTNSDVGTAVSIRVSYTDGQDTAESLTSSATTTVVETNTTDDHGDNASSSTAISIGATVSGSLENIADQDWFSVSMEAGKTYVLEPSNETGSEVTPVLAIYDPNERYEKLSSSEMSFQPETSGTYFLKITDSGDLDTGSYSFTTTVVETNTTDDHGDNASSSTAISIGATVSGSLENIADQDWFSVSMEAGKTYVLEPSNETGSEVTPVLAIYDPNERYEKLSSSEMSFQPETSGTYFLKITDSGDLDTGSYSFTTTVVETNTTDDHGDNASSSTAISIGATVSGSLENIADQDWFSVSMEAGKTYVLEPSNETGSEVTPVLAIYDPNERYEKLSSSEMSFQPETSGTYFLKITDSGDLDTGSYSFTTTVVETNTTDDHGDNASSSTAISIGATVSGSLENIADQDWFSVSMEAGKTYVLEPSNETGSEVTPVLAIYDPNERYEKLSSSEMSFQPETSGTYFLKITDSGDLDTGSYSFTTTALGTEENNVPTGSVSISGVATEGETLTAVTSSIADADGLGSFSYQWRRGDDDISGATNSSYTLTADDIGYGISVHISYTDGRGATETLLSVSRTVAESLPAVITETVNLETGLTEKSTAFENTGNELATAVLFQSDGDGSGSVTVNLPSSISLAIVGPAEAVNTTSAPSVLSSALNKISSLQNSEASARVETFVNSLPETSTLQIRTLTPQSASNVITEPLVISGSGNSSGNSVEAFVIDLSQLPSNTSVQLDNIEFAAISGSATLIGGAGSNVISADDAVQNILLGEDDDILDAGGGDDTVGSAGGDDEVYGGEGNDIVFGGSGNDVVDGGSGDDEVRGDEGDDTLTGGSGSDAFVFRPGFGNDVVTDFNKTEDSLIFYDAAGELIESSQLNETQNSDGNAVLTAADGSSVTLQGVARYSPILEDLGAIGVVNTGSGSNMVLEFYADDSLVGASVTSFDAVVTFDTSEASYVSADIQTGYLGFPNETDGVINLSGISLSGGSSADPLFTLTLADQNASEDLAVYVSDVAINGTPLEGSTLLIGGPDTVDVATTVLSRSGASLSVVALSFDDGSDVITINTNESGLSTTSITSGSDLTVTGFLDYAQSSKSVTSQDALDALRLSVGMETQSGTNTAFDSIAADFNQDGKVTSQDALAILKNAVGLPTAEQAEWVFVDSDGDYSDISRTNTNYDEGINIANLTSATELSLTGILIGDVNDSYSGLIA